MIPAADGVTQPSATRDTRWTRVPGMDGALLVDVAISLVIGLCVLAVHDVGYLLKSPYWVDEAWVSDSIRAPLHLTPFLTSSSPIGWTFLLRLVPGAGSTQRARLIPLAFAGLAAVCGYWLGRDLKLHRYLTGALVGASVLLSPAMLVRDDLKQYTAEGLASVALLWLVARLESEWSRRRLIWVGSFAVVGFLFASTVVFVAVCAFGGIALENAAGRQWRRLLDTTIVAAGALVADGAIYLLVVRPNVVPALKAYWAAYYLPTDKGWAVFKSDLSRSVHGVAPYMGFRSLKLDLALALLGTVTLVATRRYALAVIAPSTVVVNILASADKAYPFGDPRTSTYWLVMVPILAAIGVTGVTWFIATRLPRILKLMPIIISAVAVSAWVASVRVDIRSHLIPDQDVRGQAEYVNDHRGPGDVVLISLDASYGYAFYSHQLTPTYRHVGVVATGFLPEYPNEPWLVQMHDRLPATDARTLAESQAFLQSEPASRRGKIWIILAQQTSPERLFWIQEVKKPGFISVQTGQQTVLVYTPPAASGAR